LDDGAAQSRPGEDILDQYGSGDHRPEKQSTDGQGCGQSVR
jgi:hypothetical protein